MQLLCFCFIFSVLVISIYVGNKHFAHSLLAVNEL